MVGRAPTANLKAPAPQVSEGIPQVPRERLLHPPSLRLLRQLGCIVATCLLHPTLQRSLRIYRKIRGLSVGWWWWCGDEGREGVEGGGGGMEGHGRLWLGKGRAMVERHGRGRILMGWGRVPDCLRLRPLSKLSNKDPSLCQLLRLASPPGGVAVPLRAAAATASISPRAASKEGAEPGGAAVLLLWCLHRQIPPILAEGGVFQPDRPLVLLQDRTGQVEMVPYTVWRRFWI